MSSDESLQETKDSLKFIKSEPQEIGITPRFSTDEAGTKNEEVKFDSIIVKGYTSIVIKEEPINNILGLFSLENNLESERQQFHKKIFNNVFQNIINLHNNKEIERVYKDYLHKIEDLEIFSCSNCDYETFYKENLKSHAFLIHNLNIDSSFLQCPSCDHKEQNYQDIQNHFDCYHEKKTEWDGTKIVIKINKRKDIRKIKIERNKFECDLCSFESDENEAFKKHKTSHKDPENPNRFLCHACNYGNTNKTNFSRHLLQAHKIVTKRSNQIKQLKCELCDYTCNTTQYLNRHMISHDNPKIKPSSMTCEHCNFTTKHRMSFWYHMRNHSLTDEQLRTYMCEICSKRFKQKCKLDIHVITHKTMDEVTHIFKCPECPFKAKIKRNLEMHMTVHKEGQFVCDICGHRSKRKDSYKRHQLTHKVDSTPKTFKCNLCSYETHIRCYLTKHFKRHSNTI